MRADRDTSQALRKHLQRLLPLSIVLFILLDWSSVVRADGIRNPFQGAAAIAQGNAFAAQADDPTAVFYNPAGMTQLHGVQHTAGVQFLNVNTHFTSPTGVRPEMISRFQLVFLHQGNCSSRPISRILAFAH